MLIYCHVIEFILTYIDQNNIASIYEDFYNSEIISDDNYINASYIDVILIK
jgi:hypothetical protein